METPCASSWPHSGNLGIFSDFIHKSNEKWPKMKKGVCLFGQNELKIPLKIFRPKICAPTRFSDDLAKGHFYPIFHLKRMLRFHITVTNKREDQGESGLLGWKKGGEIPDLYFIFLNSISYNNLVKTWDKSLEIGIWYCYYMQNALVSNLFRFQF